MRLYARAAAHFAQMPQQSEAGDVGHRLHAVNVGERRADEVHLAHGFRRQPLMFRLQQRLFLGSGQHADTQRFREVEFASGLSGTVFLHPLGRNHAGHRKTEDGFRRINRVAPGQRDPRLLAGKTPAINYLTGNFRRQRIDGPAEDSDGHYRLAAHSENIADGVCRGNAPKVERIIDDRHKKVGSTDNRGTVAEIVDRGIIAGFIPHQQIRVNKFGLVALQDGFQHFRGNFTSATGSVAVLR